MLERIPLFDLNDVLETRSGAVLVVLQRGRVLVDGVLHRFWVGCRTRGPGDQMTPVFMDIETRSAAELRKIGSWNFARDESTRVLTLAWTPDMGETYHVWMPGIVGTLPKAFDAQVALQMPGVNVYTGRDVPDALAALTDRPWVAHNANGFDKIVWEYLYPSLAPVSWIDTQHFAYSIGLPGGLDAIGKLLWGVGKYKDGKKVMLKAARAKVADESDPAYVEPITQVMVAAYNVQDVRLMVDAWPVYQRELKRPEHEERVQVASDAMNYRGVQIDRGLTKALIRLADEAKGKAVEKIADLTDGALGSLQALQSRSLVFQWLDKMGVSIGTSLRKNIVSRFIDENTAEEDDQDDEGETAPSDMAKVVKVLELRMQALRITGGKLETALWMMDEEHRIHNSAVYHAAHTGRWAGRGLQLQNLPRPKEGVDVWAAIDLYERTGNLPYADVTALLPLDARGANGKLLYPYLSADDTASALLRSIVVPYEGDVLAAADLNQIEARMLAKLAGEDWLMEAFWDGADPYLLMAEKIAGPASGWPVYTDPKTGEPLKPKKHPYRQYVGKIPELAAGYGMAGPKLTGYAAQYGIRLEDYGFTPDEVIWAYRRSHPAIAGREAGEYNGRPYFRGGFWDQLNAAAIRALTDGVHVQVGLVTFYKEGRHLICLLPSGRRITYRNAVIKDREFYGKMLPSVWYTHPRYGPKPMYGGAFAENIVQAASRDVIAEGHVRCEESYLPVVLTCHDELVSSTRKPRFPDFMKCITTCPDWLPKFPLDAEGSCSPRYAKSPPPGVSDVVWRNGRVK